MPVRLSTPSRIRRNRYRLHSITPSDAWRCNDWMCVQELGSSPLTSAYRARPVSTDEQHPADYVLKIARDHSDAAGRAALMREALVAEQVNHPRLGVVLATHLEKPPYYLVLPHWDGVPLAQLRLSLPSGTNEEPSHAKLSLPLMLWIVRQLAEGLAALHHAGWLHGDVKPENVVVDKAGFVTLLDFGLCRRLDTPQCETEHQWQGTLAYAPPESFVRGRKLTAATDSYSLGLIFWELLTGRPWTDGLIGEEFPRVHLELRLHREEAPMVSDAAWDLLRRMTAKEPLRRPIDDELIDALARLEIEALAAC